MTIAQAEFLVVCFEPAPAYDDIQTALTINRAEPFSTAVVSVNVPPAAAASPAYVPKVQNIQGQRHRARDGVAHVLFIKHKSC